MLHDGRVATRLPAQDLDRARRFYAEKLGLEPSEERGLLYRCASGEFGLFASEGAPPGRRPADPPKRDLVRCATFSATFAARAR